MNTAGFIILYLVAGLSLIKIAILGRSSFLYELDPLKTLAAILLWPLVLAMSILYAIGCLFILIIEGGK